jgi:uncharacterized membrane protein YczE
MNSRLLIIASLGLFLILMANTTSFYLKMLYIIVQIIIIGRYALNNQN